MAQLLGGAVLANAVINIIGNTKGLETSLSEAKRQLGGFNVAATALGGKFGGTLGTIFGALGARRFGVAGGLDTVNEAYMRARDDYRKDMEFWHRLRPFRPDFKNPRDYHNEMAQWAIDRPRWSDYKERDVHGVGVQAGQMALTFGAVVGAATALGESLWNCAKLASQLAEQFARTEVTFGTHSKIVKDMANELSNNWGVPRATTLKGASEIGGMLMGGGISGEVGAKLSAELVKVATEVASFIDADNITKVVQKLEAGLRGMPRPLQELGIFMTEGEVKAKAFAMGISRAGQELNEGQKIAARGVLMLDRLQMALGDLQRSSGRMGLGLKTLEGNWEEFKTQIGELAYPVANIGVMLANLGLKVLRWSQAFPEMIMKSISGIWNYFFGESDDAKQKRLEKYDQQHEDMVAKELAEQQAIMDATQKKAKIEKASHHDLVGFYKHLQENIFGDNNDLAKQQVNLADQQKTILEAILKQLQATQQGRMVAIAKP